MHRCLQQIFRAALAVLALVGLSVSGFACAADAAPVYRFVEAASWVQPRQADLALQATPDRVADGSMALLWDRQINLRDTGSDYYAHWSERVVNATGVDEAGNIDLYVDPSYETLDIHQLRIIRDGKIIDERHTARIVALPVESSLSERIYDGRYKIDIVLEDVRVGDVIDYAYTRHDNDPLTPGHFATQESIGWSMPLHLQTLRVRFPKSRPLQYRVLRDDARPEVVDTGDLREWHFQWKDLKATHTDSQTPDWFSPWAELQLSDYASWGEVAQWATGIFAAPAADIQGIEPIVADLRASKLSGPDLVVAALQRVQTDIRYTSISIGAHSYQPFSPTVVLKRGFGDCKDKALLLVSLLHAFGIKADVALVNTEQGRVLPDWLPSPFVFDHAIVHLQLDGQAYWLDPTRSVELGRLDQLYPPDFDQGLLVNAATTALIPIPKPGPDAYRTESTVTLDLRKGYESADMQVQTRYYGSAADDMRDQLQGGQPEQRQKDYLNYFASYFGELSVVTPYQVHDDRSANTLTIDEHYALHAPFEHSDDKYARLWLVPDSLDSYAKPVDDRIRSTPLSLDYAADVRQRFKVLLPEHWALKDKHVEIHDPAFNYVSDIRYDDKTNVLALDYHYQALSDTVMPKQMSKYLAHRDAMHDDMDYRLTLDAERLKAVPAGNGKSQAPERSMRTLTLKPKGAAPQYLHVALWITLAAGVLFGVLAARWLLHHYDPRPPQALVLAPSGFGGGLVVMSVAVILLPMLLLVTLLSLMILADNTLWPWVSDRLSGLSQVLAVPGYLLLLLLTTGLMVLSMAAARLYFLRRSSAPGVWIAVIWTSAALFYLLERLWQGLAPAAVVADSGAQLQLNLAVVVACSAALTVYLRRAGRVAATFTERAAAPLRPRDEPGRD